MRREKRKRQLRVPVYPEEAEGIEAQAQATGLSLAAYLRAVGQGYEPRPVIDNVAVQQLLSINADLGRLCGLLESWLSQDRRLANHDPRQVAAAVRAALHRIEGTQDEMRRVVRSVLAVRDV